MSLKAKVLLAYFTIALGFAIYLSNWGINAHKGFAYNLGAAAIWPVVLFPGLGKIIGAVILLMVIAVVVAT